MKKRIGALLMTGFILINCVGCGASGTKKIEEKAKEPIAQSTVEEPLAQSAAEETIAQTSAEKPIAQSPVDEQYQWDLSALCENRDDFERQYRVIKEEIVPELISYQGKLKDTDTIFEFLQKREEFFKNITRIQSYAYLMSSQNHNDNEAAELVMKVEILSSEALNKLAFANEEMSALTDSFWDSAFKDDRIKPFYRGIKKDILDKREHILSKRETELVSALANAASGMNTLYVNLCDADMEFPVVKDKDGTEYTANEAVRGSVLFTSKDKELREAVFTANVKTYQQYRNTFAQNIYNFIRAASKAAEFQNYESVREQSVDVNKEIYDNLIQAANNNLDSAHRYMALRKKLLGLDKVHTSDFYTAPVEQLDMTYPYEQGRKLVTEALSPLGEDYIKTFNRAFDERWIDVYPADGKESGAYSMECNAVHPYVLLNYTDDFNSVSTLAHEMGHAVHQQYSAENQEVEFCKNPSIFTSEVASTANEMLLSDYMLANSKTDEEKLYFLFQELSLLHQTFFMQSMYSEFEDAIYKIVEDDGVLTADTLESLWLETLSKYNGEDWEALEGEESSWSRIPHFYYNYYVYQYATSIAAACSITERISQGDADTVKAYLNCLKAGDSDEGIVLLQQVGVDMTKPDFADALVARYNRLIDQIDELM